jgi:hypothetical protein
MAEFVKFSVCKACGKRETCDSLKVIPPMAVEMEIGSILCGNGEFVGIDKAGEVVALKLQEEFGPPPIVDSI